MRGGSTHPFFKQLWLRISSLKVPRICFLRCRTHNIFLSFESGAKQRPITLIFNVVERGLYSSFLQATLITDIIPKSAKNMLLTGVKNQAIMRRLSLKTILRSPECISRDKLTVITKPSLHSITKQRLPNWELLILYWLPIKYFSNCHGNWNGTSLQCCYPWSSSTMLLWKK